MCTGDESSQSPLCVMRTKHEATSLLQWFPVSRRVSSVSEAFPTRVFHSGGGGVVVVCIPCGSPTWTKRNDSISEFGNEMAPWRCSLDASCSEQHVNASVHSCWVVQGRNTRRTQRCPGLQHERETAQLVTGVVIGRTYRSIGTRRDPRLRVPSVLG